MEKILSIIVPVYKVERYINKCLNSLILPKEKMELLEIIVVNDGTPDNSAIMAKEFEKRYPETFKVIDKENGGHGSAWNKGVELATGKYIKFLDSDDWLTNLSEHVAFLEKQDSDIVFTDMNIYHEIKKETQTYCINGMIPNKVSSISDFEWLKEKNDLKIFDFWYCTYKTSIVKSVHPLFSEKIFYDDAILFIAPAILSKTFTYQSISLYNYLIGRIGQTVNIESKKNHAKDYICVSNSMVDFIQKNGYGEIPSFVIYRMNTYIRTVFLFLCLLPKRELKKAMNETWLPYIKTNFTFYRQPKLITLYFILPYWVFMFFYNVKYKNKLP